MPPKEKDSKKKGNSQSSDAIPSEATPAEATSKAACDPAADDDCFDVHTLTESQVFGDDDGDEVEEVDVPKDGAKDDGAAEHITKDCFAMFDMPRLDLNSICFEFIGLTNLTKSTTTRLITTSQVDLSCLALACLDLR